MNDTREINEGRSALPADVAAEATQDVDEIFIPAVDEVCIDDPCLALGRKGGEDESSSRPDVESRDVCPVERRRAMNCGSLRVDVDVRSHCVQLGHITQAVLEYPLVDRTRSLGLCEECAEDRLEICGKSG